MKFDGIFVDESAVFKSHNSYRSKSILELNKYIKYLGLASGVPSPNNIFQIFVQMQLLNFALGDSYIAFEQRYGVERTVGPTKLWFPTKNAEYEIRKRIDLVSYFVKREDVMKLPPRDDGQIIEVELHEDHRKLYDAVGSDYIYAAQGMDESGNQLEGNVIVTHETAVRMKLLQIINGFVDIEDIDGRKSRVSLPWNAKLIALEKKVKEILESDPSNNIIIWCRFRWEVETIYQMYKEMASYIYGGLTDKKREAVLTRWKNNDFCRIMVGMPSAAKFGHTWLKANYVIYFSGTEDYEDYAQSRDRNYRRGQTRPVTEIKIITKNTIERRVWYCIATKKKVDKFLKDFYIEKAKG
jgi:SNF2 family DNA or RNA helicase